MKRRRLSRWLRESAWPLLVVGILMLIAIGVLTSGCAVGCVDGDHAWGVAIGNARVTTCVEEPEPDGPSESTELRCHTIAGGEISEQGQGVLGSLLAPLRLLGTMLSGAGGA